MKKYTLILFFIFTFFSFLSFIFAGEDSNGSTDFQFLKMDVTARSLSLGGAFAAVSDDLGSTRYNPAGLRMLIRPQISATHMEWIEDFRAEYLAYGRPLGTNKAIGYSILYIGLKDPVEGRNDNGVATGDLKFEQSYFSLTWATRLDRYDNYLFGANLKYAREVLDYSEKIILAGDIGFLMHMYRNLSVGLLIRNIAISSANLPLEQRIGFSLSQRKVSWSLDAYQFSDTGLRYALGGEYFLKEFFIVRFGYNTALSSLGDLLDYENLSSVSNYSIAGLSLGFGFLTEGLFFLGGNSLKLDYAIVDYGRFGFSHIFTISMEI